MIIITTVVIVFVAACFYCVKCLSNSIALGHLIIYFLFRPTASNSLWKAFWETGQFFLIWSSLLKNIIRFALFYPHFSQSWNPLVLFLFLCPSQHHQITVKVLWALIPVRKQGYVSMFLLKMTNIVRKHF